MERVESRVLDAIDVDGMLEYLCELVSIPRFGGKETDAQRSVAAKLSVYEKLVFKGTPELYRKYGFSEDKIFDCLLAENTGDVGPPCLGVALYYYTFSTFESKPTLWLEDIFVPEEYRGNGVGTGLLKRLCGIAVEKGCGRFEWTVLDWNEPSRQFYYSLGASSMDGWTTFRMTPEAFKKLAEI